MDYKKLIFIAALLASASSLVPAPAALVGGFILANTIGNPYRELSSHYTSLLLKASVVGLGFGMNMAEALMVGRDGAILTAFSITFVLSFGAIVGYYMGIPRRLSHLVSSGTAICGGSAIAAVAPAVKATASETSISLGVIFLLNSIALLIFPPLGHLLSLDEHQFGMWCAMAIQDTSSVVGAASAYGEQALMVATTVKLARALWIIPVSLISIVLFRSGAKKISFPWFILLFIVAMAAASYIPIVGLAGGYIFKLSKVLLVVTLFLIGSSLSVSSIKEVGVKPLALAVILWVAISLLSLTAILYIY
ncbi:MAG: putative sulfate exporter family transporter [Rikenellaceae bacterium]